MPKMLECKFIRAGNKHITCVNRLNKLSAPKKYSTNLEFSTCDTRLPQKKSYDVGNGLALLLTNILISPITSTKVIRRQ